jgi:hypothetical protein
MYAFVLVHGVIPGLTKLSIGTLPFRPVNGVRAQFPSDDVVLPVSLERGSFLRSPLSIHSFEGARKALPSPVPKRALNLCKLSV